MTTNLTDRFQGQPAGAQDVHYTVYDDDWNGRTKCNQSIVEVAGVATNWDAVTCPACRARLRD